jgi:hypothetical protein
LGEEKVLRFRAGQCEHALTAPNGCDNLREPTMSEYFVKNLVTALPLADASALVDHALKCGHEYKGKHDAK